MTKLIYTQHFNEETIIVTSATLSYSDLKSVYTKEEIDTLRRGLPIVYEFPHMTFTAQRG